MGSRSHQFKKFSQMQNVESAMILGVTLSVIEGLAALFIWNANSRTAGLGAIAAAHVLKIFADYAFFFHPPYWLIIGTGCGNLFMLLSAVGLAQILGQERRSLFWILAAGWLVLVAVWSIPQPLLNPNQNFLRFVVRTIFELAVRITMLTSLWQDRSRTRTLSLGLFMTIAAHMSMLIVRQMGIIEDFSNGLEMSKTPTLYAMALIVYTNLQFVFLISVALLHRHDPARVLAAAKAGPDDGTHWWLNQGERTLHPPSSQPIKLTPLEFMFLLALSKHTPGSPISRENVLQNIPRVSAANGRNLDSMVARMRQKVKSECGQDIPVMSVYGIGFSITMPISLVDETGIAPISEPTT